MYLHCHHMPIRMLYTFYVVYLCVRGMPVCCTHVVMHTCNAHMLCTRALYLIGLIIQHGHSLCAQHSDTVRSMVVRTSPVYWCVCGATMLRACLPLLASMHAWHAYTSIHMLRVPVMHTLYTWCSCA